MRVMVSLAANSALRIAAVLLMSAALVTSS
jgi:hypothetical protein